MGYYGKTEFLCEKGHYWTVESGYMYEGVRPEHRLCPHCFKKAKFVHDADLTNGYDISAFARKELRDHEEIEMKRSDGRCLIHKIGIYSAADDWTPIVKNQNK